MNQFKKAKQIAQESGKKTESITDLKTAGVTATVSPDAAAGTQPAIEADASDVQKMQENISNKTISETAAVIETVHNMAVPAYKREDSITSSLLKAPVVSTLPSADVISEELPVVPVQPLSADNIYTPKAAPIKNTVVKKTVPNIFAPKVEAKSVRKSLVLKPTSVKIAENYCEKNGGSFNELVQTLLDNFIEEYGL